MQKLKESLQSINERYHLKGDSDWLMNEVLDLVENFFEKEKEQIMDAYVKGFDISAEGWNGEYGIEDFNNIKEEIKAEQYFNQTYNQNK